MEGGESIDQECNCDRWEKDELLRTRPMKGSTQMDPLPHGLVNGGWLRS